MKILVCIDDTDNIDSRGTGELASLLAAALEQQRRGTAGPVTRHQMFVHPDIPYTSHNSSMCFTASINPKYLASFTVFAQEFLARESAEGSDPGLCIVNLEKLTSQDDLITFGRKAKKQIMTKNEAYSLAHRLKIHLSEHGGTGLGIIGALAGTGLRLTGNDGRLRGKLKVKTDSDAARVAEIKQQTGVDVVKSLDGYVLDDAETVRLGEKIKAVLLEGKTTLLVYAQTEGCQGRSVWQTCNRQQLSEY